MNINSNHGELERQDYSNSGEEYPLSTINAVPESQQTPLSQNTLRLSRLVAGSSSFHIQQVVNQSNYMLLTAKVMK